MDVVEIIKLMLAPGVMVNCCGLFLLGMNNKYSVVVGRIRALDDEKRKLKLMESKNDLSGEESKRLNSINLQTGKLFYRIRLVRNAVVFYTIAVAFFIITCLMIGINSVMHNGSVITPITIISFFIGLMCVFIGVNYATKEVIKGYEIVKIEVSDF